MRRMNRCALDGVLVLGLLLCMGYRSLGPVMHEVVGSVVLALLVVHLWVNRRIVRSWAHGPWSRQRLFRSALVGLCAFCTLGLWVSSFLLSRHVFAFLPCSGQETIGLTPHQICAYWGFVWMSLHLGENGRFLMARLSERRKAIVRACFAGLALVGVLTLAVSDFLPHLFLLDRSLAFVEGDSRLIFYASRATMLVFWAALGWKLSQRSVRQG